MNYLQDLENRSVFLWQSLFGDEISADWDAPVYIDGAAAALQKAAAAQGASPGAAQEADQSPEAARETSRLESGQEDPASAAETAGKTAPADTEPVLRGLADEAAEVLPQSAEDESAEALLQQAKDAEAQASRQVRMALTAAEDETVVAAENEAAPPEREALPGGGTGEAWLPGTSGAAAASASAQTLLAHVRQTERSVAAAERSAPTTGTQERLTAADRGTASPADWSLCFEKDARRYDGAYELM